MGLGNLGLWIRMAVLGLGRFLGTSLGCLGSLLVQPFLVSAAGVQQLLSGLQLRLVERSSALSSGRRAVDVRPRNARFLSRLDLTVVGQFVGAWRWYLKSLCQESRVV